jgi:3-phosphoshikimate 1-carboxyvinyltransferase
MRLLGIEIEELEYFGEYGPNKLLIHGQGMKLKAPAGPIDCGNSGTTMRLLSGLLAAQPFESVLTGDESLSRRPMNRVILPIAAMGGEIVTEGKEKAGTPPLRIRGTRDLKPIHYTLPVASAQVKSAILLAGMQLHGKTTVTEPKETRDHTERMLEYFLVRTLKKDRDISIYGIQTPESRDFVVPGDISSAAFWLVAAAAMPDSHLCIKEVGLNPTRTGIIDVLVRMHAHVMDAVNLTDQGEPIGNVTVKGGRLEGTVIEGDEIPNVIDELPILAVAGALAGGKTIIRDAAELRVKETDRIAAVATNLRAMGVEVTERDDGMEITGGGKLKGARLKSFGDHRIAMAFAVAGMFADGETTIADVDCVDTSYPGFEEVTKRFLSQN